MSLTATLNSGVSALNAFSTGLQVISNNISNVNTVGYKSSRADYSDSFSDILRQSAPSPASGNGSNTDPLQIGTGVKVGSVTSNFSQGTLSSTGKNTDLGISGSGFFVVRDTGNAVNYVTRAGDFRLDDSGYLVTNSGYRLQGLSDGAASYSAVNDNGALRYVQTATAPASVGDIKIDFSLGIGSGLTNNTGGAFTDAQVLAAKPTIRSFTVDSKGDVVINLSNGESFNRGRVLLQNFSDPNALIRTGDNLFSGLASAGPIGGVGLSGANNGPGSNGLGELEAGALELSNVDLSKEMTDMIIAQRSFQAGSRIVTVTDQLLEETVNLKR
jgi:flagellar hook protein FlgE